jgi:hypothetical protein
MNEQDLNTNDVSRPVRSERPHALISPGAHLLDSLDTIRQYWPTFAAAGLICVACTWAVSAFFYNNQIEILKSQNSFLQDRLRVLQQNQVASASVPPSQWRRLSDKERGLLVTAFRPAERRPQKLVIYAMADSEPRQYAAQFADLFRTLGVTVLAREVPVGMAMPDVGLMVGISNFPNPSEEAKQFMGALTAAGLEVHYAAWAISPAEKVGGFDLFVGPKPW